MSRVNDPLNSLVVSIGTVKAGTQFNIITDTAVMEGTVRAHTAEARGLVEANMRRIIDATAEVMGCTAELEYTYIEPPIRNDDIALNDIARDAARSLYGRTVCVRRRWPWEARTSPI